MHHLQTHQLYTCVRSDVYNTLRLNVDSPCNWLCVKHVTVKYVKFYKSDGGMQLRISESVHWKGEISIDEAIIVMRYILCVPFSAMCYNWLLTAKYCHAQVTTIIYEFRYLKKKSLFCVRLRERQLNACSLWACGVLRLAVRQSGSISHGSVYYLIGI